MHDHRFSGDLGERLARQPRRADPRGNHDQGSCHSRVLSFLFLIPPGSRHGCRPSQSLAWSHFRDAKWHPLCWKMLWLRQFALAEGFFCAKSCRIGKEEILGLW
jgi:hypothetical protein